MYCYWFFTHLPTDCKQNGDFHFLRLIQCNMYIEFFFYCTHLGREVHSTYGAYIPLINQNGYSMFSLLGVYKNLFISKTYLSENSFFFHIQNLRIKRI